MSILRTSAVFFFLAASASAQSQGVEWGKYLAEEVAKCQECHTPRLPDGTLNEKRLMKGAVMNVQPIQPIKDWHKDAPNLTPTGKLWADWGEDALVKFLIDGLTPKEKYAGPPMPTYKLKKEDARAIVDYLKTLK